MLIVLGIKITFARLTIETNLTKNKLRKIAKISLEQDKLATL